MIAVSLGGCSLVATPSPEPDELTGVLSVENRGGPALSVRIDDIEVLQLPCDGSRQIAPGVNGVPRLPWSSVTIARVRDDVVVASQAIADLPVWYVQLGGQSLGFSKNPVAGPPGPSCPPGG